MKKNLLFFLLVLFGLPMIAQQTLHDNGPMITHPGAGFGGGNVSALHSGLTTYGSGHAQSTGFRIADDFIIPVGASWKIDSIAFFAYQTQNAPGGSTVTTITNVNARIWDGPPGIGGSNIIWGNTTTNLMLSSNWTNIWRTTATDMTNAQRGIFRNTCNINGLVLNSGTYWLDWQTGGSTSIAGPWANPLSILAQPVTGNARQMDPATGLWTPLTDPGTVPASAYGFPFVIKGASLNLAVTSVSGTQFCQGDSMVVNYSAAGTYNTGNVFTAQLSNAAGSFSAPVNIGMVSSTVSGTINCVVPTVPFGAGYRVRVSASNPAQSGSDNGTDLTIGAINATITPGGPMSFCQGGTVLLIANSGTGLTYQWTLNGNNIAGATTSSYTANASGNYAVIITSGTCTSTSSSVSVSVSPLPSAVITPSGSTNLCQGETVTLSVPSNPGETYSWLFNGTTIPGANQSSYLASVQGYFSVIVVAAGGCSDTSVQLAVWVNAAPPVPVINQFGNLLVSNATSNNQWYFNGVLIPGATAQNYTPTQAGNYTVVVTYLNGCSTTSAVHSFNTSVNENPLISSFPLFPNPSNGSFKISLQVLDQSSFSMKLIDIHGKEFMQFNEHLYPGIYTNSYDIVDISKGLYFLQIQMGEYTSRYKIVIL
jgi:archaellum component FlaF (FlaF/FlaG flagellin family)